MDVSQTVPGAVHDKKLYDASGVGDRLEADEAMVGDSGFQGIQKQHRAVLPDKKPRRGELTAAQRNRNHRISQQPIVSEHTLAQGLILAVIVVLISSGQIPLSPVTLALTTASTETPTSKPTDTPTPSLTASPTVTVTDILSRPTSTSPPAATPTVAPTGGPSPIPVGADPAWMPIVQEINGLPMVYVPAGCFMMGSENGGRDERPVHEVCLSAFWISQTEVTNAQYAECVNAGACEPPAYRVHFDNPDYANHPAVYVDWGQASAYAQWIGASLPTEAQWEYTARGPGGREYPWGDTPSSCELANFSDCVGGTAPVGSYPVGASWVGALDMAGNVLELVTDWYGRYPRERQVDPTGPTGGDVRILRGGSFFNESSDARCANRYGYSPHYSLGTIGFRVVAPL